LFNKIRRIKNEKNFLFNYFYLKKKTTKKDQKLDSSLFFLFLFFLYLNHFSEQIVDILFSVTKVTTFSEMISFLHPSTSWIVQLEWPQEVGNLFKVWSNSEYLMNNIFNTNDAIFAYFQIHKVYLK
jgi:hypothetical protein